MEANTKSVDYSKYIMGAAIVVLVLLYWQKSCSGESETQIVTIPEKSGSMPEVNNPAPTPAPEKEYVYKYYDRIKRDTVQVVTQNPIDYELLAKYLKDTTNQPQHYADAIQQREYHIPQEDSVLKTDNYISARGEVLSFKQSYTIKPQKVAVKPKETVLRMLGGVEVGNTKEFNDFSAKANLMMQNRKGNIFSVGYDTEHRIWVGYGFKIFEVKK